MEIIKCKVFRGNYSRRFSRHIPTTFHPTVPQNDIVVVIPKNDEGYALHMIFIKDPLDSSGIMCLVLKTTPHGCAGCAVVDDRTDARPFLFFMEV
jgi:hypothetical protein